MGCSGQTYKVRLKTLSQNAQPTSHEIPKSPWQVATDLLQIDYEHYLMVVR